MPKGIKLAPIAWGPNESKVPLNLITNYVAMMYDSNGTPTSTPHVVKRWIPSVNESQAHLSDVLYALMSSIPDGFKRQWNGPTTALGRTVAIMECIAAIEEHLVEERVDHSQGQATELRLWLTAMEKKAKSILDSDEYKRAIEFGRILADEVWDTD